MPHQCTTCDRTFPDGSKEMLSGCPDCGGNKFQFTPAQPSGSGSDGTAANTESGETTVDNPDTPNSEGITTTDPEATTSSDRDGRGVTTSPAEVNRHHDWPASGTQPAADQTTSEANEFSEWPDSARRPADRTSPPEGNRSKRRASDESDRRNVDSPSRSYPTPTHEHEHEHDQDHGNGDVEDDNEDTAQASARSDVVSSDELPSRSVPDSDPEAANAEGGPEPGTGSNRDGGPPNPDHGRVVSEPTSDDSPSLEQLREELNDQFESIKIVRPGEYELNLMELYDREEYIVSLQEDGRYVIDVPDSWRDGDDSRP